VDRDKVQVMLSLAEQYVGEAATIIQRQEHLIQQLSRQPEEVKAAEALAETFEAAANAMARHRHSIDELLRDLNKKATNS
jgi:hypothetical protein